MAAEVTTALIAGWDAIRARHQEVPEAVISMATGGRESHQKLAHFAANRWRLREGDGRLHEVFVTAESLEDGAHEVFASLIHEAVHGLNQVRGVADCSVSQYHNRRFRSAAAELGLAQKTDVDAQWKKKYGFAGTLLTSQTAAAYAQQIAALDRAIRATRLRATLRVRIGRTGAAGLDLGEGLDEDRLADDGPAAGEDIEPQKEDRNYKRATCACTPPTVIRVSPTTLKRRHVMCALCMKPFTEDQ